MNKRLACDILTAHHNKFVNSIQDAEVKALVKKNSMISGGAIASLLLGEPVNDYDYYFTDYLTARKVACYFTDQFNKLNPNLAIKPQVTITPNIKVETKIEDNSITVSSNPDGTGRIKIMVKSAGIVGEEKSDGSYKYFETQPYEMGMSYVDQQTSVLDRPENEGTYIEPIAQQSYEDALTLADEVSQDILNDIDSTGDKKKDKERPSFRPIFLSSNAITLSDKTQLVIRFYGTPEEVHKNYDFAHCTNYWLSSDNKLYLNQYALESLLSKQLIYQGSLYPICSVIRTRKFLRKGWWINAGQYLKMAFQISELNLTDPFVLEEQLTGVDTAYMNQVIEYCRQRQATDKDFQITTPYLISIIDKIF